jgi:hypothetical protein
MQKDVKYPVQRLRYWGRIFKPLGRPIGAAAPYALCRVYLPTRPLTNAVF